MLMTLGGLDNLQKLNIYIESQLRDVLMEQTPLKSAYVVLSLWERYRLRQGIECIIE